LNGNLILFFEIKLGIRQDRRLALALIAYFNTGIFVQIFCPFSKVDFLFRG